MGMGNIDVPQNIPFVARSGILLIIMQTIIVSKNIDATLLTPAKLTADMQSVKLDKYSVRLHYNQETALEREEKVHCVDGENCIGPTFSGAMWDITREDFEDEDCDDNGDLSTTETCTETTGTSNIGTTEFSAISTFHTETTEQYLPTTMDDTSSSTTFVTIATSTVKFTMEDSILSSTRTTTPTTENCDKKCDCVDRYDYRWKLCFNESKRIKCSEIVPHSFGHAEWSCNDVGQCDPTHLNVSNCISNWIKDKEDELNNLRSMEDVINLASKLTKGCRESERQELKEKYFFSHEIGSLLSIINQTVYKARDLGNCSESDFKFLVNETINLDACLISSPETWEGLCLYEKSVLSTKIMQVTEEILFQLTDVVNKDYRVFFTPGSNFMAAAETFERNEDRNETYEFPGNHNSNSDKQSYFTLPSGWTNILNEDKVEIAVISIAAETLAEILTGVGVYEVNGQKNKMINGRVISISVTSSSSGIHLSYNFRSLRPKSVNFPRKGIEVAFPHIRDAWGDQAYDIQQKLHPGEKPKAVLGSAQCVFFDTKTHMWSPDGCFVLKKSSDETVCECSHLTSFAVLMDVHRYVGKNRNLELLTLILCPLSELALAFTVIILLLMKNHTHKARRMINTHLSICLFLSNGMILVFLDRNFFFMTEKFCMGAAMATHYVFLCAFMWMLFQGVQLYRMVVYVFNSEKSCIGCFGMASYIIPMIVVIVTTVIGYINGENPYGGDMYCWLVGNYIWAFMAPVAVVVVANITILFIALKTAYQLQHRYQGQHEGNTSTVIIRSKLRSFYTYFKGCFSLTVILGITWSIGYFVLMDGYSKIIAAYLFTILNASQGFFIFLLTCRVYMGNIWLLTKRKLSSYFPSLLHSSNSSQTSTIISKHPPFISKGHFDVDLSTLDETMR